MVFGSVYDNHQERGSEVVRAHVRERERERERGRYQQSFRSRCRTVASGFAPSALSVALDFPPSSVPSMQFVVPTAPNILAICFFVQ